MKFKLAYMYLRKNKKESVTIIACIAIAITLILGVDIIAETMSLNEIQKARDIAGYYDGTLETDKYRDIEKLKKIDDVDNIQTVKNLGEIVLENGLKTKLYTFDENYLKTLNYKLVNGRFPKNENEIVIDKTVIKESTRENLLNKNISAINKIKYNVDETNEIYSNKNKYKIVGVISKDDEYYKISNRESIKGLEIISFVKDSKDLIPNKLIKYNTIFKLGINQNNLDEKFEHLRKEYNPKLDHTVDIRQDTKSGISSNKLLDATLRVYEEKQQGYEMPMKIAVVVVAVFTIVNFFNIILSKLTNEIGYLRIIGMSNKKVVKLYLTQIGILFVIGSIVGFISSLVFAKYGMYMFTSDNLFDTTNFNKIKLQIPFFIVAKALIITLITLIITIFLSILKSLKKYPIDIINKSDKIKFKIKNNKKIVITLLKNNLFRKKSRTIMSIIVISFSGIVLIKMIATNLEYLNEQIDKKESYSKNRYDYIIRPDFNADESIQKMSSQNISKLQNTKTIKDFKMESYTIGDLTIDKDELNKQYSKDFKAKDNKKTQDVGVLFIGENNVNQLNKYVKKGDIKKLNDNENEYINIAICNNYQEPGDVNSKSAIKDLRIGDILNFKIISKREDGNYYFKNFKGKVNAILNESYMYDSKLSEYTYMGICLNLNDLKKVTNNNYNQSIYFNTKKCTSNNINKLLKNIEKENDFLNIKNASENAQKFKIAFPPIVFLLLLISALFNIYVTISLNINNNIKEFSILRAVGLNKKSLKKVVIFEAISYGFLGSIVSVIVICIKDISYIKYLKEVYAPAINLNIQVKNIYLPPKEAILFMLICVLFALLIGYKKSKLIDKINIIEGINKN